MMTSQFLIIRMSTESVSSTYIFVNMKPAWKQETVYFTGYVSKQELISMGHQQEVQRQSFSQQLIHSLSLSVGIH